MPLIDQSGLKTDHRKKYSLSIVKLSFLSWLGPAFFRQWPMCGSLKVPQGAAQLSQGALPQFHGGPLGSPKAAKLLFRKGSEGPLRSLGMKNKEMEGNCEFSKSLTKTFVMTAFLDKSLCQSVHNATEEVQNHRSANRSEILAFFR